MQQLLQPFLSSALQTLQLTKGQGITNTSSMSSQGVSFELLLRQVWFISKPIHAPDACTLANFLGCARLRQLTVACSRGAWSCVPKPHTWPMGCSDVYRYTATNRSDSRTTDHAKHAVTLHTTSTFTLACRHKLSKAQNQQDEQQTKPAWLCKHVSLWDIARRSTSAPVV